MVLGGCRFIKFRQDSESCWMIKHEKIYALGSLLMDRIQELTEEFPGDYEAVMVQLEDRYGYVVEWVSPELVLF